MANEAGWWEWGIKKEAGNAARPPVIAVPKYGTPGITIDLPLAGFGS
jgi:hypothetical protein